MGCKAIVICRILNYKQSSLIRIGWKFARLASIEWQVSQVFLLWGH